MLGFTKAGLLGAANAAPPAALMSYVGGAGDTYINSLNMPAHQAGDLCITAAYRPANLGSWTPTGYEGWSVIGFISSSSHSIAVAYAIAPNASTMTASWAGTSTSIIGLVYRNASQSDAPVAVSYEANVSTKDYATFPEHDAWLDQSWVLGICAPAAFYNAPSGMVRRLTVLSACDTNGLCNTFPTKSEYTGANAYSKAFSIRIKSA